MFLYFPIVCVCASITKTPKEFVLGEGDVQKNNGPCQACPTKRLRVRKLHPISTIINDQQIVLLDQITNLLKTIMTTDPSTLDFKTKVEDPLMAISALFQALRQEIHSECFA